MMQLLRSVFISMCLAFGTPLTAAAQQPIVIKFSHVVAVDTPKGKAADFFAQRVAELTENAVRV